MATKTTPAVLAVRRAGVRHRLHEYRHDPSAASYGLEAAQQLGVEPARLFKTLVVSIDGALAVAILPSSAELDLRSLGKRAALADARLAERVTGYVTGGISPLGQRRRLPTFLDESAVGLDTIYVSAGRRGLQLELAPADLLELCRAETRALVRA
jgi:Cys-tRNA(Pro)/Cys-tRNA(Cys) deacylase